MVGVYIAAGRMVWAASVNGPLISRKLPTNCRFRATTETEEPSWLSIPRDLGHTAKSQGIAGGQAVTLQRRWHMIINWN